MPVQEMFVSALLRVLNDPLNRRSGWQWAVSYWDYRGASYWKRRSLFEEAAKKIREAGLDPNTFGREIAAA